MKNVKTKKNHVRMGRADRILYGLVGVMTVILVVVVLYPLIFVVSCSLSNGEAVTAGRVLFLPVDFSVESYKLVFRYKSVWTGYYNTLIYSLGGTAINIVLTTMAAYPLSRRNFQGRKVLTYFYMVTMFISGGLIPTYILMSNLHLMNTRWCILLSGGLAVGNMILMRTFFRFSIPEELQDAARIDGASDIGFLIKIVIPLSGAVYAVITLYYLVGHWNSYFTEMLYLRDQSIRPLQVVLQDILNAGKAMQADSLTDPRLADQLVKLSDVLKYSLIVVSSVPVLVLYPFVQKFFNKGVMLGSLKG